MRVAVLAVLVLAGCEGVNLLTPAPRPTLIECPFEGPEHVVEATTRSGQLWVDETIEVGVRVCDWDRPK